MPEGLLMSPTWFHIYLSKCFHWLAMCKWCIGFFSFVHFRWQSSPPLIWAQVEIVSSDCYTICSLPPRHVLGLLTLRESRASFVLVSHFIISKIHLPLWTSSVLGKMFQALIHDLQSLCLIKCHLTFDVLDCHISFLKLCLSFWPFLELHPRGLRIISPKVWFQVWCH
jgi:hypothetical protein